MVLREVSITILLLLSLLTQCFASVLGSEPIVSYIDGNSKENLCKTKLERRIFGYSGTIFSHSEYSYTPYNVSKNCIVVLTVPVGYRIRLRVVDFEVPMGIDEKCSSGDTLHVFDHENTVGESVIRLGGDDVISPGAILGQFCGKLNSSQVLAVSTQNALTLWWHSAQPNELNPFGHHGGKGFRLHWNAFRESKNIACNLQREFGCSKVDECIPSELACNKQADCLDGSDVIIRHQMDYKCENLDFDPLTTISGLHLLLVSLATVICLVAFCICACFMCRCLQKSSAPQTKTQTKNCVEAQGLRTMADGFTPYPPSFLPPSPPKVPQQPYANSRQNAYLPGFPKGQDPRSYGFPTDRPASSGEYAFVRDTRNII
ncbi:unnamed protein product, partial [Mesorhabditis belari]|uniref:CUB domain-containing protein n=1 Tax=Mesorhabditis belari TaxID=2138241 RepID=A0AAF3EVG8_9BILA